MQCIANTTIQTINTGLTLHVRSEHTSPQFSNKYYGPTHTIITVLLGVLYLIM